MEKLLIRLNQKIFLIFCLFLNGRSSDLIKIDYKEIEYLESSSEIDFCNFYNAKWDSILIIPPYAKNHSWKSLNIKNINSIQSELEEMESIDWKYYLVFVESKTAVAYIELPRTHLDFNLSGNLPIIKSITNDNCVLDYVENRVKVPNN